MEESFINHLKPLMRFSEVMGLTYITDKSTNILSKIINKIIRISLVLIYVYTVYEYIFKISHSGQVVSEVLKIGDIIAIIAAAICFFLKWLHYYIKRRRALEIIFKVYIRTDKFGLKV